MEERRVEFLVEDEKVVGVLHLPDLARNEGVPAVIASHGFMSHMAGQKYVQMGKLFPSHGIAFLRFDHRGALGGQSEGAFEETTLTTRVEDLKGSIDLLSQLQEIDSDRLGLIGSSLGGVVVLLGRDERIRARVVMATPFRFSPPSPEMRASSEGKGYYQHSSGTRIKTGFYQHARKYDLHREVEELRCPLLILHGGSDEQVPPDHAQLLYQAAREPKELRIVEGADIPSPIQPS